MECGLDSHSSGRGPYVGSCEHGNKGLNCLQMEYHWPAERLSASQRWLCSMHLVVVIMIISNTVLRSAFKSRHGGWFSRVLPSFWLTLILIKCSYHRMMLQPEISRTHNTKAWESRRRFRDYSHFPFGVRKICDREQTPSAVCIMLRINAFCRHKLPLLKKTILVFKVVVAYHTPHDQIREIYP